MVLDIKVLGRKINNTDTDWKLGLMELLTREITSRVRSTVSAVLHGQMVPPILVNSMRTTSKEEEYINGPMVGSMMGNG